MRLERFEESSLDDRDVFVTFRRLSLLQCAWRIRIRIVQDERNFKVYSRITRLDTPSREPILRFLRI